MPPPPAEPFAARVFLGPALRAQPDRRLVKLVREGYEAAFEEIVRRYRKPLDRFAAAIVGGRSEDVTQDAFSKALLALRGTTTEIELKPWLYRIVRNTALNEIRDSPPPTEELGEAMPGAHSAAVEAERREEIGELMERLRALPEPQRAAIVMRELEGLSHEEIAAALGVSGGAARQAIYRARASLRDGFGLLIPLPLLRLLFDHGTEAGGAAGAGGAVAAAGAASAAAGGAGATLGGLGAAGALKVGLATVVLAGSVGAGVAMQHDRSERGPEPAEASAARLTADDGVSGESGGGPGAGQAPAVVADVDRAHGGSGPGDDKGRDRGSAGHSGHGSGSGDDLDDSSGHGGPGPGPRDDSGHGGRGSGHGGRSGSDDDSSEDVSDGSHSGRGGPSGSSGSSGSSGHGGSGSSGSGDSSGRDSGSGGGGDDPVSGSGDSGHGGDSGSSGGPVPTTTPPPPTEPPPEVSGDGSGGDSGSSGSGSGDDGSSGGGSGGGEPDS
jgi:RNA polymerase sigma factor (sigma-70 family)